MSGKKNSKKIDTKVESKTDNNTKPEVEVEGSKDKNSNTEDKNVTYETVAARKSLDMKTLQKIKATQTQAEALKSKYNVIQIRVVRAVDSYHDRNAVISVPNDSYHQGLIKRGYAVEVGS